jgi:biotin transport system substrate-specific component
MLDRTRSAATASHHATLFGAVVTPTDSRTLDLAIKACAVLFITVLTAAAAQISVPLPFTPVPLTFQPMVVLLGGAVLGPRLGALSQVLYLAAGLAGLPVFAASSILPQGPARLLGPTGGYLMSYPFAAGLTGLLAARGFDRRYLTSILAMAAGLLLVFACGAVWLLRFAPLGENPLAFAIRTGIAPFVVVDAFKIAVAAAVLPTLWKLLGR